MPAPKPTTIIDYVKQFERRAEARQSKTLERLFDIFQSVVVPSIESEIEMLAEEIALLGGSVKPYKIMQLQRYIHIINQIDDMYSKYGRDFAKVVSEEYRHFLEMGIAQAVELESLAISLLQIEGASFYATYGIFPQDAIRAMIAALGDEAPLKFLAEQRFGAITGKAFTDLLLQGLANGWNPRKVAAKSILSLRTGLDKSLLIARDQMIRAHRNGALMRYQASNIVIGYRRMAAHSKRTCIACLMLDGKLYSRDEMMPLHPQDRCTIVPVFSFDKDKGYGPFEESNGRQFFLRQPADVQAQMLGVAKYRLWKQGKIELDDLIKLGTHPDWGDTLNITTLQELMR